jgi:hypothetical protein
MAVAKTKPCDMEDMVGHFETSIEQGVMIILQYIDTETSRER